MTTSTPQDYFATTHWSVVIHAGNTSSPKAEMALEELCRRYWYPLYAYARHGGATHQDAEDLVQGFFSQFLKKNYLEFLAKEKGRFRAFLLQCFKNHRNNEWQRAKRQKRGGCDEFMRLMTGVPLDWAEADEKYRSELMASESPDRSFDQAWVITVLERVLAKLGCEMETKGKSQLFEALKPGLTVDGSDSSHQETARQLNMTEAAVRMAAMRLRQRYQELIREEILETCDPEYVEREIWALLNAFSS